MSNPAIIAGATMDCTHYTSVASCLDDCMCIAEFHDNSTFDSCVEGHNYEEHCDEFWGDMTVGLVVVGSIVGVCFLGWCINLVCSRKSSTEPAHVELARV